VEDPASLVAVVPESLSGERVDKVLATLWPEHSRSTLQRWLKQGLVVIDDEIPRQRDRVGGGESIEITVPEAQPLVYAPETIPLVIRHEDPEILVIEKPAGLVVHPGAGNARHTLLNGLLAHDAGLSRLPRAGIVHRLDKDTSGLMVVAKTERARQNLIAQLADRSVQRVYLAVVNGVVITGGTIDEPIGRDPRDRRRMMVAVRGRPALTRYRVERRFRIHTLVRAELATGRTHQIRVHFRHIGFPLLGDPVYGGRLRLPKQSDEPLADTLRQLKRQALHATQLSLTHPGSGDRCEWHSPLPEDIQQVCDALERDMRLHGVE